MKSRTIAFVETNLGMLLIIVAQFFFVCMNLGVKQLDSLDVPMHTLEVCSLVYIVNPGLLFCSSS